MNQARGSQQAWTQANPQANYTQADSKKGGSSAGSEAGDVPARTQADYAAALTFASRYTGEWNVQKYLTGEEWKIYELGKRMAIAAYNFLNDGTYTTGGYNNTLDLIKFNSKAPCENIILAVDTESAFETLRSADWIAVSPWDESNRPNLFLMHIDTDSMQVVGDMVPVEI